MDEHNRRAAVGSVVQAEAVVGWRVANVATNIGTTSGVEGHHPIIRARRALLLRLQHGFNHRTCHVAEGFLLISLGDLKEVADQHGQRLLLRDEAGCEHAVEAMEEVVDSYTERLRDLVKPARGHPVDAFLVLVDLLVGDPDQSRQLLLAQAQHDAPLAHLDTNK